MRISGSGRGIALGVLFAVVATTAAAAPCLLVSGRIGNETYLLALLP